MEDCVSRSREDGKEEQETTPLGQDSSTARPPGDVTNNNNEPVVENILITNIKTLRNKLPIIDINFGLLDELRTLQILTSEQREVTNSKQTISTRVGQLLDNVISLSNEQLEQFVKALELTNQKHVVNYIQSNGVRVNTNEDWPVYYTQLIEVSDKIYSTLVEVIDSRNGLLDELASTGCLNNQHKEFIEACHTNSEKNRSLIDILRRIR